MPRKRKQGIRKGKENTEQERKGKVRKKDNKEEIIEEQKNSEKEE